jgi:uncharacterized protein
MTMPEYPLQPDRDWPVGAPFWRAVDAQQLRFPQCTMCRRFVWYPLPRCPDCHTPTLDWTAIEPVGEVYSYTVVRRAFLPELAGVVPITVVLARFPAAPGVTLVTGLADTAQADRVAIGAGLRIVFPQVAGAHRLPLALLESGP